MYMVPASVKHLSSDLNTFMTSGSDGGEEFTVGEVETLKREAHDVINDKDASEEQHAQAQALEGVADLLTAPSYAEMSEADRARMDAVMPQLAALLEYSAPSIGPVGAGIDPDDKDSKCKPGDSVGGHVKGSIGGSVG